MGNTLKSSAVEQEFRAIVPVGADDARHSLCATLRTAATEIADTCPERPETRLAIQKVTEALFWAVAALDREEYGKPT